MAKSAQQKARRKEKKRLAKAKGKQTVVSTNKARGPVVVLSSGKSLRMPVKKNKDSGARMPFGMSMVSDGVNSGSIFKNTSSERVTFPVCREKVINLDSPDVNFNRLETQYINPGNSSLFPIFSQIASCYEEYKVNVLRFYFRTEEYMASGSSISAGLVGMATQFDPNDASFDDLTSLENYEHGITAPPFTGVFCHDVLAEHKRRFKGDNRRDLALNNYYVYPSHGDIGPSDDQAKFYDLGKLTVASHGVQAATIGELWVEYSFTMIRRKQPEIGVGGSSIHIKQYTGDCSASYKMGNTPYTTCNIPSLSVGYSGIAPGSTLQIADMNDIGTYNANTVGLRNSGTLSHYFNLPNVDGTWLVSMTYQQCSGLTAAPSFSASGGAVSRFNQMGGTVGFPLYTSALCSITQVIMTTRDAAPDEGTNKVALGGMTGFTAGGWDLFIVRIPTDQINSKKKTSMKIEGDLDDLRTQVAAMQALMKQFPGYTPSNSSSSGTLEKPSLVVKESPLPIFRDGQWVICDESGCSTPLPQLRGA